MRAGERYRTRIERETAVRFEESDLFRTARGSFAYPADLAAIAGRPRAKESFGSVKNRRGVPNPIFLVMMPKVVGVVLDQMTRIVRFWSFAFLNNSIIAVQEKIPLYKVLKMLFRESAMDS